MIISSQEIIAITGTIDEQINHYKVFLREIKAEPEIREYARKRLEYLQRQKRNLNKTTKSAA